jgi:hypothetical protein
MQYVMLIYHGATPPLPSSDAWKALSQDEQRAIYAQYDEINKTSGVTAGVPLGLPENATTVEVKDGRTVATEGPYLAKEALGGYYVFEARDLDAAIEMAARIPAARLGGAVEVRPSATYW